MSSFTALSPAAGAVSSPLADVAARAAPPLQKSNAPTVAVPPSAVQPAGRSEAGEGTRPSDKELQSAVDKVSKAVSGYSRELQFSIDPDLKVSVVKVIDTQTQEMIRQIPSEEMLDIAKNLDKALGILIQQKA